MKLYDVLTDGGKQHPYGMTLSAEIADRIPGGSTSMKCADGLYLVRGGDGGSFVYDCSSGQLSPAGSYPECSDINGFDTEFSMAPGTILPVRFREGSVSLGEEYFAAQVRKIRDRYLIVDIKDSDDAIVFDCSRFLLYALADGKFLCGYAEV